MSSFRQWKKLIVGVGAVTGATVYYLNAERREVFNSWTTNHQLSSSSAKWDENWDHRSPKSLVRPRKLKLLDDNNNEVEDTKLLKPKATRHLLLIRHGQYDLNGQTDEQRILTNLGRMQAEHTGKRLKELGLPYSVMVKSTMSRAQETGSIISNDLPDVPVSDCALLCEGAPIPPEPPVGHWKPEMQFFRDGPRIEAAFRKYFHRAESNQDKDSYTIIVCHANVIRYFVCRALQFPPEAWLRFQLNHASITWISILPSGRVVLRALGDSGHLPANAITSRALQFPPEAWLRFHLNHASITWISILPSGRVVLHALGDSGHMPASVVTSS